MSLNISENVGRQVAADDFERQATLEGDQWVAAVDQKLSVHLADFAIPLQAVMAVTRRLTAIGGLWAIIRGPGRNNTFFKSKGSKN